MQHAKAFSDLVSTYAKNFYVPDILLPTSTCIFVLESPHIQEVKHGAPVAGSSGATMSKHLFGPEFAKLPLGLMMKKNADERLNRPRLNGIGLLNVLNIPMQRSAYGDPHLTEAHAEWFADMEHVRTTNQKTQYAKAQQAEVQDYLIEQMRNKLQRFAGREITFIPCGRFAQKYVRLADVTDPAWRIIEEVPHPSYNSWDRERYRPQIEQVVEAVVQAAALLPQEG